MKNSRSMLAQTLIALLLPVLLGLVACQKKSEEAPPPPPPPPPVTAMTGTMLLPAVLSTNMMGSVKFTLDLMSTVGLPSCGQPIEKTVYCFTGPAFFRGMMRVSQTDPSICNLALGDYVVNPVDPTQVSMMSYPTILSGGTYEAVGPGGRVVFRLSNAVLSNTSGLSMHSPHNRANLNLILDFVNGAPCGSMGTY